MFDVDLETGLPAKTALGDLLGEPSRSLSRRVEAALLEPVENLVRRPSKRFRAELVKLGHLLGGEDPPKRCERTFDFCTQAIELLHAGSMIVDDIQDGSSVRRGAPALHRLYGVPGALCAGNWLYFWPLRLIREASLAPDQEHRIIRLYCDAVERAHYGQAVDLSVRIDDQPRQEVPEIVAGVAQLKTGSITSLAMCVGGVLADAPTERLAELARFGEEFGVTLQDLDDLGNLLGRTEPEKRYEDLIQGKPSAVWAEAARTLDAARYAEFAEAVRRLREGDAGSIESWVERTGFARTMLAELHRRLAAVFARAGGLPGANTPAGRSTLNLLEERLLHAYC